jgi:hypothetical protein
MRIKSQMSQLALTPTLNVKLFLTLASLLFPLHRSQWGQDKMWAQSLGTLQAAVLLE